MSGEMSQQSTPTAPDGQPLAAMLDHVNEAVAVLDRTWRFAYLNRSAEQLLRRRREELLGKELWQEFPRGVGSAFDQEFRRAVEQNTEVRFESFCQSLGLWLRVLAYPSPAGLSTHVQDITDLKHAEELNAAKQAAEAASAAKDEFLAILSHELRTPLTPVLMLASALEQREDLPGDLKENLGIIRRNTELEARLIGDLLDVTRIRRGKLEVRPETMDAHESLRQTLQMLQSDIAARQLDVVVDLKAEHSHVHADPARLQQVFWNVIGNAVKFTPSHGRIVIQSSHPREGLLRITVTDTGIGIETHALSKIFHAFEQAEPGITRSFGGLGLGLTICKALLEMQGGSITAQSEGPGKGSTFTVELPTAPEKAAEAKAPDESHAPVTRMRILLVEDHASTAQVMSHLLRRLGHDVKVAEGVHQALELAREQPLDLIISDLVLPDGSGMDLMRQVKSQHNMKGISLSGYGRPEDVAASQAAGFAVHLTKPIDLPMLVEAIDRVCR